MPVDFALKGYEQGKEATDMTLSRKTKFCICIAVLLAIFIYIYVYYTVIIKIRPFPEDGDVSVSGCYVTKLYAVTWDDSKIVNWIYYYPAFIKVFDAKTKKCVYTSDIYDDIYLYPLFKRKNHTSYGFYEINTSCNREFTPPEEFTPDM